MKRQATIIFLTVFVLALPCRTNAALLGTVELEYDGPGASGMAKLWAGGLFGANRRTGVYMLDKTGGTGDGEIWDNGLIGTFCIELSETAPYHTKTYDVVLPEEAQKPTTFLGKKIGFEKADYIRELWGRFFDPSWVNSESFTTQQNKDAEAFAVALWEIIYEDLPESPSVWDVVVDGTPGQRGFRCENVDTFTANSMLHALDGTGSKANLRAFVYDGQQDYLAEVPEPTTIFMLGLSSLVLFRGRRK